MPLMDQPERAPDKEKDKAIEEFLKSFKIALNNSQIYFKGHSLFNKSVEDLKVKLNILNPLLSSPKIGITPNSLLIDGKFWEKIKLYMDLAELFHRRKIKAIEIKPEATNDELAAFLTKASMPVKDIFKQGGLIKILKNEGVTNIHLDELDYSFILSGAGEEEKDLWTYLLYESIESKDAEKIKEFSDHFDKFLKEFNIKELLGDQDLKEKVLKFLIYIKDNDSGKFQKCMRETLKAIMQDARSSDAEKISNANALLKALKEDNFADNMWQEILTDDNFDPLSFKLFFKLINQEKHQEIAENLAEKVKKEASLRGNAHVIRKIKELFSIPDNPDNPYISKIYHNTLSFLIQDISPSEGVALDRALLSRNYRFILLNLLVVSRDKERVTGIIEKITAQWDNITNGKDIEYLKCLWQTVGDKKKSNSDFEHLFDELLKKISDYVERLILEDQDATGSEFFWEAINSTTFTLNDYIKKIFGGKKVAAGVLKLFFKFFPKDTALFYENLRSKRNDLAFLEVFIGCLKALDSKIALDALIYIYGFSNNLTKQEVLKAMPEMSVYDERFLISVATSGTRAFKIYALNILRRDAEKMRKLIDIALLKPSPFGINNYIILRNMALVEEVELKEARSDLEILSRRKFFWHKNVRQKAQVILRKWND